VQRTASNKRISAAKRISKQLSYTFRRSTSKDQHELCDFRGLSVVYLTGTFEKDLLSGILAPGVELVAMKHDLDKVNKGSTGRIVSRGSDSCSVHFPYMGQVDVPNEFLIEKPRSDWNTEDVCEYTIKNHKQVQQKKCEFTRVLPQESLGKPFEGCFVSQARRNQFGHLLKAMRHYFGEEEVTDSTGRKHKRRVDGYVWLDIFGANQPLMCNVAESEDEAKARSDLFSRGLHIALSKFDKFLLFLDDYGTPLPLTRTWCVWELYGVAKYRNGDMEIIGSGGPFQAIGLKKRGDMSYKGDLSDWCQDLVIDLSCVKSKNAQCFQEDEKRYIDAEIVSQLKGGHEARDIMIMKTFKDYISRYLRIRTAGLGTSIHF